MQEHGAEQYHEKNLAKFLAASPLAGSGLKVKRSSDNAPTSNEIEAANRAEATALLIRAGYRVYRPEADCYGEDLILRFPDGKLLPVQLKARPTVDWKRYGNGQSLWMLFPDPARGSASKRKWFLIAHDEFYEWVKDRHGHTPKWNEAWSYPSISKELRRFLDEFVVIPA